MKQPIDINTCVLNKISHMYKSKVMSRGNIMSHVNSTSRLVKIPHLISWKLSFPQLILAIYMQNIVLPHMSTYVCRNEVIIEQYHA